MDEVARGLTMRMRIQGGTVVVADGSPPIQDGLFEIEGDRVVAAGRRADFSSGADAETIDAQGCTIMPGLIDTHVHVFVETQNRKLSDAAASVWALNYVQTALRAGLTTIRDLGAQTDAIFGLRQALNEGWAVGPRLLASGRGICMTGGHGWTNLSVEADGPDGVRRAAREELRRGADAIKLMATGGAGSPGELPTSVQLTVEEMRAAVEEAHKAGKPAVVHALAAEGITDAVLAGADSIEHGVFLDERGIELMLKHDVALCPTISVYPRVVERGRAGGAAEFYIRNSAAVAGPHFESLRRAVAAGVKIVFGTDSTRLYNQLGDIASETELMVRAGMTPLAVIESATRVAAAMCRLDGLGTLTPGAIADVLIVDGDATADIAALGAVRRVIKGGVMVHDAACGAATPGLVAKPIARPWNG
jgi:imidazolonepropionase-like amidohydrolase